MHGALIPGSPYVSSIRSPAMPTPSGWKWTPFLPYVRHLHHSWMSSQSQWIRSGENNSFEIQPKIHSSCPKSHCTAITETINSVVHFKPERLSSPLLLVFLSLYRHRHYHHRPFSTFHMTKRWLEKEHVSEFECDVLAAVFCGANFHLTWNLNAVAYGPVPIMRQPHHRTVLLFCGLPPRSHFRIILLLFLCSLTGFAHNLVFYIDSLTYFSDPPSRMGENKSSANTATAPLPLTTTT